MHPSNGRQIESLFQSGSYHSFAGSGDSLYFSVGDSLGRSSAVYRFKKSENTFRTIARLTDVKQSVVDPVSRTIIGVTEFEVFKISLDNPTSRELLYSTGGVSAGKMIYGLDYDPAAGVAVFTLSSPGKWSLMAIDTATRSVRTVVDQLPYTEGYIFPDLALDASDSVVFAILSRTYTRRAAVIHRYDLNSGQQQILSPAASGALIHGLALDRDSNKLFWGENGNTFPYSAFSGDYNGGSKQLVQNLMSPIAEMGFDKVAGKPVIMTNADFFLADGSGYRRMPFLAADKIVTASPAGTERLYFTTQQSGKLFSTDLLGQNVELLAEAEQQPIVSLDIDQQRSILYWVESNGLIDAHTHSYGSPHPPMFG